MVPIRRKRQAGNPRPFWGFRPTSDVAEFIDDLARTSERSTVLLTLLEEAIEARRELGDEFFEVERRAKVGQEPTGKTLGRLAKGALKGK